MRKYFGLIALMLFMLAFVISSTIYTQSESSIIIAFNMLIMLVSGYFIVRTLDELMGFKE